VTRPAATMRVVLAGTLVAACSAPASVPAGGAGGQGAQGGHAGHGGAVGGAGAPPEGCVDVETVLELLPPSSAEYLLGRPRQSGAWTEGGALRLGWTVTRNDDPTSAGQGWTELLAVSSFDAANGEHVATTLTAVFPSDLHDGNTDILTVGGANGLAAASDVSTAGGADDLATSIVDVATGSLVTRIGTGTGVGLPTYTTWDGEAFSIHAHGGPPPRPLLVMRIAPDGTIVLPWTQYGESANVGYGILRYDLSFDPVSGRTWAVDGLGMGYAVSGHERDGTDFLSGPLYYHHPFESDEPLFRIPRVAAVPDGAVIVFTCETKQGFPCQMIVRLDAEGVPVGEPLFFDAGDFDHYEDFAVKANADGTVSMLCDSGYGAHLRVYDPVADTVSDPVLVVDDSAYETTRAVPWFEMLRSSMLFGDDELFAAWEAPTGWRAVKLAPGCVYRSNRTKSLP
jgi:hypothetical protein